MNIYSINIKQNLQNRIYFNNSTSLKFCVIALLFFTSKVSLAQDYGENIHEIEVFKTHTDYMEKSGEIIGKLTDFIHSPLSRGFKLEYKDNNGSKSKYDTKNVWGFRAGDKFFRTNSRKEGPMCIINIGNYIYYEIGVLHMRALLQGVGYIEGKKRNWTYFSKELKGEIVNQKQFLKEQKKIPSQAEFCNCVKKAYKTRSRDTYVNGTRLCVEKNNEL